MPEFNHTVNESLGDDGMRLDRYIAENLGLLSRSQIKARQLKAKVNGKEQKISRAVKNGDKLEVSWKEAAPENIIPENIALNILYEDERVVVLNKRQGMVVHPGAGNFQGTLANALYHRTLEKRGLLEKAQSILTGPALSGHSPGAGHRPGIVHRLDKDTTGVMIAAYDDEALAFLAEQFKNRTAKKTYIAVVSGILREKKGRIETYIARNPKDRKRFAVSSKENASRGKLAITYYSLLKTWNNRSLLMLRPKTGRTHQLRVHMRSIGHPIVGDPLYGSAGSAGGSLMLHARKLEIVLPGEQKRRVFKAPVPQSFREVMGGGE